MTLRGDELDWPRDGVGGFVVETGDFFGTGHPGCRDGPTCFMVEGTWSVR